MGDAGPPLSSRLLFHVGQGRAAPAERASPRLALRHTLLPHGPTRRRRVGGAATTCHHAEAACPAARTTRFARAANVAVGGRSGGGGRGTADVAVGVHLAWCQLAQLARRNARCEPQHRCGRHEPESEQRPRHRRAVATDDVSDRGEHRAEVDAEDPVRRRAEQRRREVRAQPDACEPEHVAVDRRRQHRREAEEEHHREGVVLDSEHQPQGDAVSAHTRQHVRVEHVARDEEGQEAARCVACRGDPKTRPEAVRAASGDGEHRGRNAEAKAHHLHRTYKKPAAKGPEPLRRLQGGDEQKQDVLASGLPHGGEQREGGQADERDGQPHAPPPCRRGCRRRRVHQ
mmetsp:Transcript_33983/g.58093  ORF Transcript_33983/g.58093 Transcript_33983/m.58093 type:complete len:344 (+) Transcript_33983:77-1108(+)